MIRKKFAATLLFFLFFILGVSFFAQSAEPPCRQRVLSICNEDQGALICKLLSYDEPETPGSITAFLSKIAKLDSEIQQDLICARLMGKKKIVKLNTAFPSSADAVFRCGIGVFKFKINDPNYAAIIASHRKLRKFNLCPSNEVEFDITGMVMDVDAEYDNRTDMLKSFVFTMEEVAFSNIKTIYAEGGFDVQRKPLEKRIDEEYLKYFNAGKNSTSTKKEEGKNKTPHSAITEKALKTYKNSIGMEFVLIPVNEDKFACGGIARSFYIGKYEVTQSQWETVMGSNPINFKGADLPVEQVSWNDVQDFIQELNILEKTDRYRLPTEAEWEYAARAGSTTKYCFGDDESLLDQYAWYDKNSGNSTHPVGGLKPSAWGLYDMHGNVREWCQDCWNDSCLSRVLRGGSWFNDGRHVRSAYRDRDVPGYRYDYSGSGRAGGEALAAKTVVD